MKFSVWDWKSKVISILKDAWFDTTSAVYILPAFPSQSYLYQKCFILRFQEDWLTHGYQDAWHLKEKCTMDFWNYGSYELWNQVTNVDALAVIENFEYQPSSHAEKYLLFQFYWAKVIYGRTALCSNNGFILSLLYLTAAWRFAFLL